MMGNRMTPTFPRTYQAPMKAVNAANKKPKRWEEINAVEQPNQKQTKYEKKMATNHLLGRGFAGVLW
jgi:hypothetical protein